MEDGRKVLVIVVDEDDDLGTKTDIKSPLIGREKVLEAAVKLAVSDPEEADANAMFAAIKIFDELSRQPYVDVEVAVVTGRSSGGIGADLKLSDEIDHVRKAWEPNECVIVTDGPLEQSILALISSRMKVSSIKTVVVKQSPGIEQTWLLFMRYLRMVITDPRYAKLFLGMPGIVITIIGVLQLLSLFNLPILLAIIGAVLIVKGFNIDDALARTFYKLYILPRLRLISQIRIFTLITGIIILIVALNVGIGEVSNYIGKRLVGAPSLQSDPQYWLSKTPLLLGVFLNSTLDLMLFSGLLTFSFHIFYYFVMKSVKVWRYLQSTIVVIFLWTILKDMAAYLIVPEQATLSRLIVVSIVGFITLAAILITIRSIRFRIVSHFRRGGA